MKPIDLKEAAELALIIKQTPWVLVKFYATSCEPCQLLEPVFNRLKQLHAALQTVSINVDLHPELTRQHAVRLIPTLVLFKEGVITDQLEGMQNEEQLNDWLNQQVESFNIKEKTP